MQFPLHEPAAWASAPLLSHDETTLISCLKALPAAGEHGFVTAETFNPHGGIKEVSAPPGGGVL